MIDRRRRIRWANLVLAGIFVSLGRYALFGPQDTLFTIVLARQGMEETWGMVLLLLGALHTAYAFSACVVCAHCWARGSIGVITHGASAVIMLWTYITVGLFGGVYTPTVEVCLWLAFVLAAMTVAEARASVKTRRAHGYGYAGE